MYFRLFSPIWLIFSILLTLSFESSTSLLLFVFVPYPSTRFKFYLIFVRFSQNVLSHTPQHSLKPSGQWFGRFAEKCILIAAVEFYFFACDEINYRLVEKASIYDLGCLMKSCHAVWTAVTSNTGRIPKWSWVAIPLSFQTCTNYHIRTSSTGCPRSQYPGGWGICLWKVCTGGAHRQ